MPSDACWSDIKSCTNGLSYCFWLYMIDCTGSQPKPLISFIKNSASQGVKILCTSTNDLYIQTYLTNQWLVSASSVPVAIDYWIHICYTFSLTQVKVYRNGASVDTKSVTQLGGFPKGVGGVDFIVGDKEVDSAPMSGASAFFKIDDFSLWNQTLTPSEISSIFSSYP